MIEKKCENCFYSEDIYCRLNTDRKGNNKNLDCSKCPDFYPFHWRFDEPPKKTVSSEQPIFIARISTDTTLILRYSIAQDAYEDLHSGVMIHSSRIKAWAYRPNIEYLEALKARQA